MFTTPTVDTLLEGVIFAINDELMPTLGNAKAQATAAMIQSVLQQIRQTLPVLERYLVEEHNGMTRTLKDAAAALDGVQGEAADRIRGLASTLGSRPDLPPPLDADAVAAAHRELGEALNATIVDIDVLLRAGESRADAALQVVRAHLGPRYVRDVQTVTVGGGFLGRG